MWCHSTSIMMPGPLALVPSQFVICCIWLARSVRESDMIIVVMVISNIQSDLLDLPGQSCDGVSSRYDISALTSDFCWFARSVGWLESLWSLWQQCPNQFLVTLKIGKFLSHWFYDVIALLNCYYFYFTTMWHDMGLCRGKSCKLIKNIQANIDKMRKDIHSASGF